jgi:hypothetical protein
VRCPYCVLGDEFRSMVVYPDGRFICAKCGHLADPGDKNVKGSYWKCLALRVRIE